MRFWIPSTRNPPPTTPTIYICIAFRHAVSPCYIPCGRLFNSRTRLPNGTARGRLTFLTWLESRKENNKKKEGTRKQYDKSRQMWPHGLMYISFLSIHRRVCMQIVHRESWKEQRQKWLYTYSYCIHVDSEEKCSKSEESRLWWQHYTQYNFINLMLFRKRQEDVRNKISAKGFIVNVLDALFKSERRHLTVMREEKKWKRTLLEMLFCQCFQLQSFEWAYWTRNIFLSSV